MEARSGLDFISGVCPADLLLKSAASVIYGPYQAGPAPPAPGMVMPAKPKARRAGWVE